MLGSFRKANNQVGISLLEVMLSLSVIAIILIMATRYFFVASNNNKVNTTISQVGALIAAAHSYKGAAATYKLTPQLSIDALKAAGQLDNFPGYDDQRKQLLTLWGGIISIAPDESAGEARITVNMPDNAKCLAILRAYPTQTGGNITSACNGAVFTYTFP